MSWEKPDFEEINMSAEIGAYQGDEDGSEYPPFVSQRASDLEA
jgi:coenzyme PQQ precursor peptide PqqA